MGLKLIAYGNDWQREDALERMSDRIRDQRRAFPTTPTLDVFVKRVRDKFSEADRTQLQELQDLCTYANTQAEQGISRDEAQLIYCYLVVMLYGVHGKQYL